MSEGGTSIIDWVIRGVQLLGALASPLSTITALSALAGGVWAKASGLLDMLVVRMDDLFSLVGNMGGGAADFRPLAFVNFVFPFTDFLGLVAGYLALLSIAAIIRIIKSFIPTVA